MEDLLAVENYRWGNKNGLCRYFTVAGLEREESWRAFNPGKAYDTIDVQDLKDPNKYEQVIVKTESSSLRHGTWKFSKNDSRAGVIPIPNSVSTGVIEIDKNNVDLFTR